MTTILQLNSAARSQGANSTLLANELTEKLRGANPGAKVVVRDLLADALPHLDDSVLGAFFTPAEQRTPEQAAIAARSDALIAELQAADIIVIGAPMYNFGVSRSTANGPAGLVTAKRAFVVSARGGKHAGTPADSQASHIKTFLGFIGITDVSFVYAEGMNMGPDAASAGLASAREAIAALA